MKLPFDIKFRPQIESGEYKVETISGYPVTIYRWDFDDGEQTPIMGSYVFEDGKEYVGAWSEEGHFDLMSPNDLDLIIIGPKQEWSEEDEAAYNAFICEVVNEKMNPTIEQIKWLIDICDRLKSLRPSWKPSEEQPEVQNGKFIFPKYLYARTKDNKTIDMSYAPQDMTAVEYTRADLLQQEQPQVADASKMGQPVEGLEKEIVNYYGRMPDDKDKIESARHFAEWGANHSGAV